MATITHLSSASSPVASPPSRFSRRPCRPGRCPAAVAAPHTARPVAIKASAGETSGRRTLSGGWDVSATCAGPSMSRMEELDTSNMLLRQRIVFLCSQIDTDTADLIISQLLLLDAEDKEKEIRLFISSPGGSVTSAMGIYDAMKLCKADVSTVCLGLAASVSAFLLAAGTKGKRFCMPNARVMIHHPSGPIGGSAIEMALQLQEHRYQEVKMNKILSRITGKPEHQVETDTEHDLFLNPWEAVEYGLVDAVIDDGKPGLVAPIAELTPPPKTQIWYLWKLGDPRNHKRILELPSEDKLLQNGYKDSKENDGEKDTEQTKGMPTSV